MVPTGQSPIGIVQGRVISSNGVIFNGTGFTSQPAGNNTVIITLTDPALLNPAVTATTTLGTVNVINESNNQFTLSSTQLGIISFIAVGPVPPSINPP